MDRLNTEGLKLTRDEATELLSYHLAQASLMFQAVPDDVTSRREVYKTVARYVGGAADPALGAAMAFYDNIFAAYEKMKEDD